MSEVASSRSVAVLASCIALAGTGCIGRAVAARDASAPNTAVEGVIEAQPPDPSTAPEARHSGETATTSGSEPSHDPHRGRRALGWISLAIGAEAAVVAVTTSFMLMHQKSVLDDHCDAQRRCSSTGMAAAGAIDETVPVNTVSWIVAAAGLGVGTVILLTSRAESGNTTAVTVAPETGGVALGVRSTF